MVEINAFFWDSYFQGLYVSANTTHTGRNNIVLDGPITASYGKQLLGFLRMKIGDRRYTVII